MEQKKPDPIEPVQLTPMDMHGPIETNVAIYVLLPDARVATLNTKMQAGHIPTRAEIKAVLDAILVEGENSIPKGTRLLTKPEFISHITKRETGAAIPMPGDQQFVAVPGDVPRAMLLHAIRGVELTDALRDEYIERGMGRLDYADEGGADFVWLRSKLDEQPEGVLLAIYQRITGSN